MVSKQRLWQLQQRAQGKCIICGAPAVTKNHCAEHAKRAALSSRTKARERERQRKGWQPWRPGGKGRPPQAQDDYAPRVKLRPRGNTDKEAT